MNNPVAQMDFAQRSVPETARVTKFILKAFYGTEQKKSYFAGCSNGGRMAAMEALRYPKDFDGIISGAPVLDGTGLDGKSIRLGDQGKHGAGRKTGIIARQGQSCLSMPSMKHAARKSASRTPLSLDPRACHFKPSVLAMPCRRRGRLPDRGGGRRRRKDLWRAGQFAWTTALSRRCPAWFRAVLATLGHRPGDGPGRMALFAQDFYRYHGLPTAARPGISR